MERKHTKRAAVTDEEDTHRDSLSGRGRGRVAPPGGGSVGCRLAVRELDLARVCPTLQLFLRKCFGLRSSVGGQRVVVELS